MDRDAKFSAAYRAILENAGVARARLPPRSPNLNAHLERFMRTESALRQTHKEGATGNIKYGQPAEVTPVQAEQLRKLR
jgi:transposase InsO family protein